MTLKEGDVEDGALPAGETANQKENGANNATSTWEVKIVNRKAEGKTENGHRHDTE